MILFKVGRVTHYYDKIGVAIVEIDSTLSVGDSIKFSKDGQDLFSQVVDSIQVEHEKKETAVKGEVIGLKTKEPVKADTDVYKI